MRKMFAVLGVLAAFAMASPAMADILANWGVEAPNTPADVTDSMVGPNVPADSGVYGGTLTGWHASAATDWTTPTGNGSTESLSSNTWTVGDYYHFSTSTVDYASITVQWDQTSSNTGPRDFSLNYSLDGVNFTWVQNYVVLANVNPPGFWSAATPHPEYQTGPVLLPPGVDDQTVVYFRLIDISTVSANGGTVAAGGTNRVDNIIVSGTYIPEPATLVLLAFGSLALLRRR